MLASRRERITAVQAVRSEVRDEAVVEPFSRCDLEVLDPLGIRSGQGEYAERHAVDAHKHGNRTALVAARRVGGTGELQVGDRRRDEAGIPP
jgi:hypothetical protein